MKTLLYVFLIICSIQTQAQHYDVQIEDAFETYKKAYLSKDLSVLTDMSHPNIVELGGGVAYYVDHLNEDYDMYDSLGLQIRDIKIKTISKVLKQEQTLQAMVPYVRTLKKKDKEIVEQDFFLAMSHDQGTTWSFTDMKSHDPTSIKLFIPKYNERLNIYLNSVSHK